MLYAIAFLALLQLIALWGCFELARCRHVLPAFVLLLGVTVPSLFVQALLASVILTCQFIALIVLAICCLIWKRSTNWFLPLATTASILIGIAVGFAGQQRWNALKEKYPVVSLADRLSYERKLSIDSDTAILGQELQSSNRLQARSTSDALQKLDAAYESQDFDTHFASVNRAGVLQRVHESQVAHFIDSDGFGVGRMARSSPSAIEHNQPKPPVPMPQPVRNQSDIPSEANAVAGPLAGSPSATALEVFHTRSLVDFAPLSSFGYVQDRNHVVGFNAHGFTTMPKLRSSAWHIQRVELVSLLKHERPMVYQSEFLPKMDELKSAPVRPLDAFEQRGLTKLRAGESLAIESSDRQILMLGAIRAATQCLQCHSVERGALLGAFSYELLPDGQRAKTTPSIEPTL